MHSLEVKGSGAGRSVHLELRHVLLTPPLGTSLTGLASADLPILGQVVLSAADVTLLPYVGHVDVISTIHSFNANIQQAPGGFIIRGSVSVVHDRQAAPTMLLLCTGLRRAKYRSTEHLSMLCVVVGISTKLLDYKCQKCM